MTRLIEIDCCRDCRHIKWVDYDDPARPGYAGDAWECFCNHPDLPERPLPIENEDIIQNCCPLPKGQKGIERHILHPTIRQIERQNEERVMKCRWYGNDHTTLEGDGG